MKIVFDTNIIYKDFSLSNSTFQTFFDGLKRTGYSFYIPRVVYDEVINKYCERLRDSKRDIENVISKFERFVNREFNQPVSDIDIQNLEEEYRSSLNAKLTKSQVNFLDYPKISHQDIVQRMLQRRKPFNEKGAGYRDTLIWQSILELATSELTRPIAFISNNLKDFAGEDGSLHPDLLHDVQLQGDKCCEIYLFPDLESFVNEHIKPTMKILEDIQVQLASNEYPDLNLEAFITEKLISFVGRVEFESEELGFSTEFETPSLSQIEEVHNIDDIDVRQLSTGELIISLSAIVWAQFDFFVYKADYYTLSDEDQQLIWDHNWNEHYMAGSMSREVNLKLSLIFDTTSKQVTSSEIIDISPIRKLDFVELGKILEEFNRRHSQQMAKILDSSKFVPSNVLQPILEQTDRMKKLFEEIGRQQSDQMKKILASSQFSSKALEPLLRQNDEIKKMLGEISRQQSERIAKLFESFRLPDEILKGTSWTSDLQTPAPTTGTTEENEDESSIDNKENSSDDDSAQDEDK